MGICFAVVDDHDAQHGVPLKHWPPGSEGREKHAQLIVGGGLRRGGGAPLFS